VKIIEDSLQQAAGNALAIAGQTARKRNLVKKETYFRNKAEWEDSAGESDDDSDPGLYEPKHSPMRRKEKFRTKDLEDDDSDPDAYESKHSPMRRKEKFRTKDFKEEKKHKERKRNFRNKMKHDFEF